MQIPPVQPLLLGDIIRRTFRLYGESLSTVVVLALLANLPLALLGGLMGDETPPDPALLFVLLVAMLVVTGVVVNAMYLALLSHLVGRPAGVLVSLRWSMARVSAAVMLAYMITNALSHVGLILFILPGLLIGGLMAAAVPIVVVERRGAFAAIGRSFTLLKQDLMKGIGVFAFGTVISELLPLQVLLGMQVFVGRSPFSPLLAALLAAITMPFALAANLHLYLSLRATEVQPGGGDRLRVELLRLFPKDE